MNTTKNSISLSQGSSQALMLLQQNELEKEYLGAEKEADSDFEITTGDGLDGSF